MRKIVFSVFVVLTAASVACAQPPEGRQGRGGPGGGPPGGPGGFRGPLGFHLMTALDADKDGKISAKEIENAVAALQKLDADKDGKLSAKEIGWPPTGGFGGGGRGGFPGGGNERPLRPNADGEARSVDAKNKATDPTGERRFFSREQLSSLDRDNDGKITKDEIPKGLQDLILDRVDTNKDGVIDKEELGKVKSPPAKKD